MSSLGAGLRLVRAGWIMVREGVVAALPGDQLAGLPKFGWRVARLFTKRGAIAGLLPHGPHNVRDVLATHILKKTGSYEQASYAIQDSPETVAEHYGRFLPSDKDVSELRPKD